MAIKEKTIEEKFIKLSPREHVIKRPDTYVGSCIPQEINTWVVDKKEKIVKKTISYIPAFLKIFDEIITNASDHAHRPNTKVKNIKINIDNDFNISVWNDGTSIPVEIHKVEKIYVPEMIFGHLMTGTNYDDTEIREGAGRNGLGSKLTNIFSKKFIIDLCDGKKHYYQEFYDNLSIINDPIIKSQKNSYTCIQYLPDFTIFKMSKQVKDDTLSLFKKRIYDLAVYNPNVNVIFNDVLIEINSIKDWALLHLDEDVEYFEEKINDKWSIVLAQSTTDSFEQCSIVNGNTTWLGGTHVDYIVNQLVKELSAKLTKGKNSIKIKPADIKNKFHIFLVSTIGNPIFNSQTKETLSMKIDDKFELSDKLYKNLLKSEIIKSILEWVALKEQAELNKINKKAAGKTLRIPKLVDAHLAGTAKSLETTMILAEGDSAVQTCLAGISVVGRDKYGCFPLKGKVLNVRDIPVSKISENEEIEKIIKILGLVPGKKYTDLSELRYGKVVFMTDQDIDGYSIKGLLINLFHTMWPELLTLGYCFEFITPIIKAKHGKKVIDYFDLNKYKQDKENGKLDNYNTKYYKGLGTISPLEIKEMFKNLNKHLIKFQYNDTKEEENKIDLVFRKKRANERKDWLLTYKGEIVPDKYGKDNNINDFFDTEFIQFSNGDNIRSIPHLMDGFKPSTRKIMYAAFKRLKTSEKDEMKVAQFGAYTAEVTAYHNGENSLFLAIVGMAQNFINTNNISLLMPSGQFGSRRNSDAFASPRYIFTYLNPLTEYIFRKEDRTILNYLDDDGMQIEPEFYLPIIPTLLVNGSTGIGTGWSTDIPKYNPLDLIEIIKRKLNNPNLKYKIHPFYKDWKGTLEYNEEKNAYISTGIFTKTKKGYLITELPVDMSTDKYISILDKLCDDKKIKNYIDNSTDVTINIEVITDEIQNPELVLRLTTSISLNNMNMFDDNKIIKYDNVEEIINLWIDKRLKYYEKRKIQYIKTLDERFNYYLNCLNFIGSIIVGDLIINNRKKEQIINDLEKLEFDKKDGSFNYLLNIPVYNLSKEKFDEYKALAKDSKRELKEYKALEPKDIWLSELDELKKQIK